MMPMTAANPASTTGLLLSGGLDSCILLGHLLRQGHRVQPFYIRSGVVWQREELRAVRAFFEAMARPALEPLVVLEMPVDDLYGPHWSLTGRDVPDAESDDTAVYLPGRNALLTVKPLVWCRLHDIPRLALGVLAANPFADATPAFFAQFTAAMNTATGGTVEIVRPLANLKKRDVMQLGRDLPLELTFSCIAPVDGRHCGRCNKCAERQAAFRLIDVPDPTPYAAASSLLQPH